MGLIRERLQKKMKKNEKNKNKKNLMSLNDYKVSKLPIDVCGDDCLVIIGIEKNNINNIELYGYDYDITRIEERKRELDTTFTDYLFVIKRFYSVL